MWLEPDRGLVRLGSAPLRGVGRGVRRLDALIYAATRTDVARRLPSADEFLKRLDAVEQDSLPGTAAPTVDLLTAVPGQVVDGDWVVERVLGTSATSRALLVNRQDEQDDGTSHLSRRVFKVALDEDKASRLRGEARTGGHAAASGSTVIRVLLAAA